jgi:tripartite-type tricarboxylate transporter receptor subunit TctC
VQASWKKQGADAVTMNPQQFTEFMDADIKKWAQVVKISGAKVGQ